MSSVRQKYQSACSGDRTCIASGNERLPCFAAAPKYACPSVHVEVCGWCREGAGGHSDAAMPAEQRARSLGKPGGSAGVDQRRRRQRWHSASSWPTSRPQATPFAEPGAPGAVRAGRVRGAAGADAARYLLRGGGWAGLRHAAPLQAQLDFGACRQAAEAAAPLPTLAQRAFPARANPMAVAASSAAGVDVSPPSVLLRHPDRGTGASSASALSPCYYSLALGPGRRAWRHYFLL